MRIEKSCISLILLLLGFYSAYSQNICTEGNMDPCANGITAITTQSDSPTSTEAVVEIIEPEVSQVHAVSFPMNDSWQRHLYLKTNLLGLGAAVVNLAFEVDIARHWSFSLPIYYSAWDYFKSTLKFRTFAVQPEFRYWFSRHNDGFFLGAHFSMAYYNLAFDGTYRYQDRDGDTPALGGGLNVGYRTPLGKQGRWKMEFSVGVGYYPLEYDIFHNTRNGALSHYEKRKYLGVDQASISLAYMFNRNKRSK